MTSRADAYGDPSTRTRILEAAREVVAERGMALTLADVAGRAGVSRQAVYLHVTDRTGLLIALVQRMDETLQLSESLARVQAAAPGPELIEQTMALHSTFTAGIDPVALVLEAAQDHDPALGAAWRDRMTFRHQVHRQIVQRLADAGVLAPAWTVDMATDLFHSLTLPGPWRELTRHLGWDAETYVQAMTALLVRALLVDPGEDPPVAPGSGPGVLVLR